MNQNFNKDTAQKDLLRRRPLNVRYAIIPGQTWIYFDAEDEGAVEWLILDTHKGEAKLEKRTGVDVGYQTLYAVEKMNARRWWPKESSVVAEILWNCPSCNQSNPILVGDYMCEKCRAKQLT